jgi:hypothetical protein
MNIIVCLLFAVIVVATLRAASPYICRRVLPVLACVLLCVRIPSALAALEIQNAPATNILRLSATLQANVIGTNGTNPTVVIYYGYSDGLTNSTNWDYSTNLGVCATGICSVAVSNLLPAQYYYFTAHASETTNSDWPSASTNFETGAGAPTSMPSITGHAVWVDTNGIVIAPSNLWATNAERIKAVVGDPTAAIATLSGRVDVAEGNIVTNAAASATLSGRVDVAEGNIVTNSARILMAMTNLVEQFASTSSATFSNGKLTIVHGTNLAGGGADIETWSGHVATQQVVWGTPETLTNIYVEAATGTLYYAVAGTYTQIEDFLSFPAWHSTNGFYVFRGSSDLGDTNLRYRIHSDLISPTGIDYYGPTNSPVGLYGYGDFLAEGGFPTSVYNLVKNYVAGSWSVGPTNSDDSVFRFARDGVDVVTISTSGALASPTIVTLNNRADALEGATNALNTRMGNAEGATNVLNIRVGSLESSYQTWTILSPTNDAGNTGWCNIAYSAGPLVYLAATTDPTVVTFDNSGFASYTNGVLRVGLEIWPDTNTMGFDTVTITNESVTIVTGKMNSVFYRRTSTNAVWVGRQ